MVVVVAEDVEAHQEAASEGVQEGVGQEVADLGIEEKGVEDVSAAETSKEEAMVMVEDHDDSAVEEDIDLDHPMQDQDANIFD